MSHASYFIISLLNISQKDIYHLVLVFICFSLFLFYERSQWMRRKQQKIYFVGAVVCCVSGGERRNKGPLFFGEEAFLNDDQSSSSWSSSSAWLLLRLWPHQIIYFSYCLTIEKFLFDRVNSKKNRTNSQDFTNCKWLVILL